MPTAAGRCSRSPRPNVADVGTGRINGFIRRDKSRDKVRSALLVAGLAGLGRISTDAANSLNRRYGLGLGHVTSWTRMIDAAAARGQAGTVLVLTGTGFQTPSSTSVPAAHLYHAIAGAQAHRPGLHRADDRRRGPFADVTPDDRALVDRFLDMMAAEAGASRHTLAAYRNDLERAAESCRLARRRRRRTICRGSARPWAELAPSTVARRSAALRRFFGFLVDDGLRNDDPSAALPRPRLRAAAAANPRRATKSSACSRRPRTGRRAASRRRCATSRCSSCSTARACGRASWSACRAARCGRASRS